MAQFKSMIKFVSSGQAGDYSTELEQIAGRVNKSLDFSKIGSREDYIEAVNKFLRQTKSGRILIKSNLNTFLFDTTATQTDLTASFRYGVSSKKGVIDQDKMKFMKKKLKKRKITKTKKKRGKKNV